MIERMAKAIHKPWYRTAPDLLDEAWDDLDDEEKPYWIEQGEAALDALLDGLDKKGWTELTEEASGGVGHYLWLLTPEGRSWGKS
jgi:hypothetical protein